MPVKATCHCGAVELTLTNPDPISTAARCTCSFCKRRQAGNISVTVENLTVTKGADALSCYTWGTKTAQHFFCSECGIYTHHQRRSDPNVYGVNVGCIGETDPSTLEPIPYHDGVNHPSDD